MTTIIIDTCANSLTIESIPLDDVTVESCDPHVTVSCDDDNSSPPASGLFELEFFNQLNLFVAQPSHRLPRIRDAMVLDLQRTRTVAEITINHTALAVTVQFLTPQSGFLLIY